MSAAAGGGGALNLTERKPDQVQAPTMHLCLQSGPPPSRCSLFKIHEIQESINSTKHSQYETKVTSLLPGQAPHCCSPGVGPMASTPGACRDYPAPTVCHVDSPVNSLKWDFPGGGRVHFQYW